jgi:hypothetical protein
MAAAYAATVLPEITLLGSSDRPDDRRSWATAVVVEPVLAL